MNREDFSLKRPLALGTICFGGGMAVVVLITGLPKLWTPEAAGWASAIATCLAVIVALHVGLTPHRWTEKSNRQKAQHVGLIVHARLERMALYLEAAKRICDEPVDVFSWNTAANSLNIDPSFAEQLSPYFDVMPPAVATNLASTISAMERTQPLFRTYTWQGSEQQKAKRLVALLVPLIASMDATRRALGEFVNSDRTGSLDAEAHIVAESLRGAAASARKNAAG